MDPVDDIIHYKYGLFYYNPMDERVIVPKRIRSFGYTFNFARKKAYLLLLGFMLLSLVPTLL